MYSTREKSGFIKLRLRRKILEQPRCRCWTALKVGYALVKVADMAWSSRPPKIKEHESKNSDCVYEKIIYVYTDIPMYVYVYLYLDVCLQVNLY